MTEAGGGPDAAGAASVPPVQVTVPFAGPRVSARAVARAMAWAAGSQIGQLLIQLPVTIALSRLLLPREFGLMGMVLVFSRFLTVFVEAGLGSALVQRKVVEPRHLASAFWMNLGIGAGLMVVVAAAAPGVAALYHEPRLTALTAVISTDFFIGAFGVVQLAMLQRDLRFRRIAVIQNLAAALGGAAAIAAAVLGLGVWSLVVDTLAVTLARSVLATRLGVWRPRGRFERAAARDLWRFSAHQTGFQAVNYWSRNADNFIVGRFVGAYGLGIYDRAYQLMLLPMTQAGFVVSYVLLPALSQLQDDHPRLKAAYLRTVGVTALLAFPLTVGLFVVAPDFVLAFFGPRWSGVTPLLRVLCLAALPQAVGTTTGVLYQTQGRTDWLFRWGLVSGAVTVAAFAIGVWWGVMGVAVAYAVRSYALQYFNFAIPGRLIGMRYADVFAAVRGPLLASLGMGAAVWAVAVGMPDAVHHIARLGVEVAAAGVAYLALVHLFRLSSYREARALVMSR